jgi:O-antigen/teichoic acid export membrane protein
MVKLVVGLSIAAAVLNVLVNLALIPAFGAVGAGIGTCVTLLGHNVLKQAGLRRGTGISVFDRAHARVYVTIVVTTVILGALTFFLHPPAVLAVILAAIASAAVLLINRAELRVGSTFPELARIPVLRRLIG